MNTKYYIAYGSNLNVQQMRWRCPTAKVAGIATLRDWRLLFRGSGSGAYLTIEQELGAETPVGVWRITDADERALDRYEGFPRFYYKRELEIEMQDIKNGKRRSVKAMVYIMREDRPIGIPSTDYLRICGKGYVDFGFDWEPLEDALTYSKAMSRKEVI